MKKRLKKTSRILLFLMLQALVPLAAPAPGGPQSPEPAYLYKTTFVRAAPGKLLDLIALYKSWMVVADASGDERPFWWRHTQGDQWDLMLLFPMGELHRILFERKALQAKSSIRVGLRFSKRVHAET